MRAEAVHYFTKFKALAAIHRIENAEAIRKSRLYLVEPDTYHRVGESTAERLKELVNQTWDPGEVLGDVKLPFESLFIVTGRFHAYRVANGDEGVSAHPTQDADDPFSYAWLVWLQEGMLNVVSFEVNPETREYALTKFCCDDRWDRDLTPHVLVACLELNTMLQLINTPGIVEEALYTSKEHRAYQDQTGKQLAKAFRIVNAPKVATDRAAQESYTRAKASQERIQHSRRASQHLRIAAMEFEAVRRYESRGYRCYPWDQIPEEDRQEIARRGPNKNGQVPSEGWVGLKYYDVAAAEVSGRLDPAVPIRLVH